MDQVRRGTPRRGGSGGIDDGDDLPADRAPASRRPERAEGPRSFVGASLAFVSVFVAAGTPIALYNDYKAAGEVSAAGLTVAFAAYVTAACAALLVLGRLSDHLGRRPVAFAALGLALLGTLLLTAVHGTLTLVAARALQGLAAGLAASSIGALVVDAAPTRLRGLAAAVTAGGAPLGLAVGAAGAGALVQHAASPRLLSYVAAAALVVLGAVSVAVSDETRSPRAGAWRSVRPRVAVPRSIRPALLPSVAIFVSTWAMGAFYQASGTSVVREQLGVGSPLVASLAVSALLAASAVAGVVTGRVAVPRPELSGMTLAVVGAVGVAVTLAAGLTSGFVLATVVTGVGWGVSYTGALQHLLARTEPGDRAGVLSLVYVLSYGGAAVPGFVASGLFASASLVTTYLGYLAILVAAWVVVLASAMHQRHHASSEPAAPEQDRHLRSVPQRSACR